MVQSNRGKPPRSLQSKSTSSLNCVRDSSRDLVHRNRSPWWQGKTDLKPHPEQLKQCHGRWSPKPQPDDPQPIHQSSTSAVARIKPGPSFVCYTRWEQSGIRSTTPMVFSPLRLPGIHRRSVALAAEGIPEAAPTSVEAKSTKTKVEGKDYEEDEPRRTVRLGPRLGLHGNERVVWPGRLG